MRTIACFVATLWSIPVFANLLSLERYLDQVRGKNQTVLSAQDKSVAAFVRTEEADHLIAPALISDVSLYDDRRKTNNPSFQGTETKITTYSLGLAQMTPWGMNARLTYNIQYTQLIGVNASFVPLNKFYDAKPMLELSQPLFSNAFGISLRAHQDLLEASAMASSFGESYRVRQELMAAEMAYWRLSLARKMIALQKANLERAEKIKAWNVRRVRLSLADRSDLLQAEALVKIRQLELQSSTDEEIAAGRSFNTARGATGDTVNESLSEMDIPAIQQLRVPPRIEKRDDVQMSEQLARAAEANATVLKHKGYPSIELYGSYALNGRDDDLNEATKQSLRNTNPLWVAGVRMNAPLDFFTLYHLHGAYTKESIAANVAHERKLLEQEQEWTDLTTKFDQSKKKLDLAFAIENAQKEKLNHERSRFEHGRSTNYQVLLFEQDFASAQVSRIQAEALVLQLMSQLKLFGAQ